MQQSIQSRVFLCYLLLYVHILIKWTEIVRPAFFVFPLVRKYTAWTIIINFIKRINLFLLFMQFSHRWLLFLLLILFSCNIWLWISYIYHWKVGGNELLSSFVSNVITYIINLIDIIHPLHAIVVFLTRVCVEIANKVSFKISISNMLDSIDRKYHNQKERVFTSILKCEWCCTSALHIEFLFCLYSKRFWVQLNDLHVLLTYYVLLSLL